ncbi:hypothetical protein [Streptomyces sp. CC208A]|uniref:hypothetical protein n=1 Tax=Streptomyces sp. CC208A TaxID=3044573 RepID=UPI0024A898A3|nr:hypothetical protein [Streptomyces sp. CC208A]
MRRRKQPVLVAVALCLGGALTACGSGDGGGYTAVGAGPSPGGAVGPSGAVTLVPLDSPTTPGLISSTSSPPPGRGPETPGPSAPGSPGSPAGPSPSPSLTKGTSSPGRTGSAGASGGRTEPGAPPVGPSSGSGSPSGGTPAPSRTPGATPTPTGPAPTTSAPRPTTSAPAPGPAVLTVSAPVTADADRRWCERVTVTFRNTGGSPVTSGTVTFATHVIGALDLDWGTVTTSQPLPAPIAAGTERTETYTVCVDSWRVPLGMRVDTQKVTATWE